MINVGYIILAGQALKVSPVKKEEFSFVFRVEIQLFPPFRFLLSLFWFYINLVLSLLLFCIKIVLTNEIPQKC